MIIDTAYDCLCAFKLATFLDTLLTQESNLFTAFFNKVLFSSLLLF